MAFTRYYDDPDRIMKKLQESTSQGMYQLNQPGNGERPPFMLDPSIILQKWGANLCHDRVGIETELRGSLPLSKDIYSCPKSNPQLRDYSIYKKEVTSASRTLLPVWVTRDVEQAHWVHLQTDPQYTAIMPFSTVSSRLIEKDRS